MSNIKPQKGSGGDDLATQYGQDEPMLLPLKVFLGLCYVLLAGVLIYLVYALWPVAQPNADGSIPDSMVCLFGYHFTTTADIRLILLVAVVGALGSYVHAATSFADFEGNRRLFQSWSWWYVLRVFVGASLALIIYFVWRAGMFSVGAEPTITDTTTFSFAAVSGLAGMFSKQAIDKLADVFDNIFKTKGEEERRGTLSGDHPRPEITKLDPAPVNQKTKNVILTVYGKGFVKDSTVRLNGDDRVTKYVSTTKLTVKVPDELIASSGDVRVTVFTPPPGGGSSDELILKITPQ